MMHTVKSFPALEGLTGFSQGQIAAHLKLYEGYVKKINEIEEKLLTVDRGLSNYSFGEYSELKRREAVALNGAYLHEMYFESLGAGELTTGLADGALKQALIDSFGSLEDWEKDLRAAAGSTPGWVLLTFSKIDGKLHHYIMFEHHIGLPVHQVPIMALDVWEHAFMIDFGISKPDYVSAFLKNLNWGVVEERFAGALA
ncbi:MAG: Fe-Mn family superoxide dismutase [Candidatus Gracilibacteria bacterium]|jgi:Fe-Mn family superoxide dismutase